MSHVSQSSAASAPSVVADDVPGRTDDDERGERGLPPATARARRRAQDQWDREGCGKRQRADRDSPPAEQRRRPADTGDRDRGRGERATRGDEQRHRETKPKIAHSTSECISGFGAGSKGRKTA